MNIMTIYSKIKLLLEEHPGLSISKLEKELGFGSGTIRKWQNQTPAFDKVEKVASYLNVPITYFSNEPKEPINPLSTKLTSKIEFELKKRPQDEQEHLLNEVLNFFGYQVSQLDEKKK